MKTTKLMSQGESKFSLNTKQSGEALESLTNLKENSVSLVFFDPQCEPCGMFYLLITLYIFSRIIKY